MRISVKWFLVAGVGLGLMQLAPGAEEKPQFKDQKEKISYGIGMNIGNNLKRSGYDVDVDVLAGAIKDVLAGKEMRLNEAQAREALMNYQKELNAKREEERMKLAEKNRKAGEEFLAENKKKEGIKVLRVTLPDGTNTAELQYKVLTEGTGELPKSNDTVTVNYRGTLIDGKEFDSSAKRGQPAKFQLTGVIRGWTEALKIMKAGSKWQLFIPSALAYGDRPFGQLIEPGSTLLFDLELVSTEAPPALTPPQPLTSDIIKVPSADELKKGAKIEVIKPEDVDKKIKEEKEKEKEKK
jgi:FKBP-type peptidyl-prolyl cis-trans isomerase FklB